MAAPSLRSSLDLIQDATFVHQDEFLSFSQLDIASPHMPPYLVDSEDEIDDDESDDERDDYLDVNDFISDEDDSDDGDDDDDDDDIVNDKSILNNRPPSRLGRPLSPSPRKSMRISKRHGPSVARIKMENAFLKNQNNKLAQELEQCRLTIQALKNIVGQKDVGLQNVRTENQQAVLKIKVLEALLLSKHARDGSITVRSGDSDNPLNLNNLPLVDSFLQDETLKKEIPRKPVSQESDSSIPAPQQSTQPPLRTAADAAESSDDDLLPPPLPPKKPNRHIRRWSMDFGPNNRLGYDEVSLNISSHITSFDDLHNDTCSNDNNNNNHNNNDHHLNNNNNKDDNNSNDNNTLSMSVTPTSSTLTPSKDHDLQRSVPHIPRILRRRTGDIIQSLASCRPSSTKNGYDYSPPCTPSSDSSENDESVIDEKSGHRRRKSTQRNLSRFRKIFLR